MARLVFVGTSDTAGMPVHRCECSACSLYRRKGRYNSPTCAYIELEDGLIFIDSGSDEFIKIREGRDVHAHFLTHFHSDHAYGLLRLRHTKEKIPLFHPEDEKGFADLFKRPHGLEFIKNRDFQPIFIKDIEFTPIPLKHSKPTNGYLIRTKKRTIAYLTDCSGLSKESLKFLQSQEIDAIFLDASYAIGYEAGKHLNFLEANSLIDKIGSKDGFLIHQSHYSLSFVIDNKIDLKYRYIEEGFSYEF